MLQKTRHRLFLFYFKKKILEITEGIINGKLSGPNISSSTIQNANGAVISDRPHFHHNKILKSQLFTDKFFGSDFAAVFHHQKIHSLVDIVVIQFLVENTVGYNIFVIDFMDQPAS